MPPTTTLGTHECDAHLRPPHRRRRPPDSTSSSPIATVYRHASAFSTHRAQPEAHLPPHRPTATVLSFATPITTDYRQWLSYAARAVVLQGHRNPEGSRTGAPPPTAHDGGLTAWRLARPLLRIPAGDTRRTQLLLSCVRFASRRGIHVRGSRQSDGHRSAAAEDRVRAGGAVWSKTGSAARRILPQHLLVRDDHGPVKGRPRSSFSLRTAA